MSSHEGWMNSLINTISEKIANAFSSTPTTRDDASTLEEFEKDEWEGIGVDQCMRAQQFLNSVGIVIAGPLLKEMMKQELEDWIYCYEIGETLELAFDLSFEHILWRNCCVEESLAECVIENILYKNPLETREVGRHWLCVSLKTQEINPPNGRYLTSKKFRISSWYDRPLLAIKYGSLWKKIMQVLIALHKIEDRSLHLKVWYFFASLEHENSISGWEMLSRLYVLEEDRSVFVEKTKRYFENLQLGDSPYFLITQSKIFCIIFTMYSQDETNLFPFTQELKVLFQSYLDNIIKKYQCLNRIIAIFQISISIIEKDDQLRKEIEKNKVRMLITIKDDMMGELSRLCSALSYKIKPTLMADFMKCVCTVCQEAERMLAQI